MTYLSVDVETTGLNPIWHSVTSLSVVEVMTERDFSCRILQTGFETWDEITAEWAKDNIPESVNELPEYSASHAVQHLRTWLDMNFEKPYTFVAWPASFDYPFFRKLEAMTGVMNETFHYRTVDVKSYMAGKYNLDIAMGRDEINKAVGFELWTEPAEPHNPYNDALEQARVFRRLLETEL